MLSPSLVTAGVVAVALGFGRVRSARHLEAKLAGLRVVLIFFAVALLLDVAAVILHVNDLPSPAAGDEVGLLRAQLLAQRRHDQQTGFLAAGVLLQLALLVPVLVHVLRDLAGFVLAQRADLVARDQAAERAAGRPVST